VNVVFAQIMTQVGPPAVAAVAEDAGIAKDEVTPPECAMALGGLRQGVSPLEQAAAYAAFAAKGVYAAPYSIATIRDRDGHVVYEHGSPKRTQAFRPEEAGVLTAALEGVVQNGTGTAAQIGRPLAGKTGTTENYGDAWFIGYVPQMSTAVWVGYPDSNRPMRNVHGVSAVTGGTLPAETFSRYMRSALAGVAAQPLYTASPDQLHLRGAPTTAAGSTNTSTAPSSIAASAPSPSIPSAPSTSRAPVTTVTTPAPATTRPAPTPTFLPAPTPTTEAPKAPQPTVAPPTTAAPETAKGPQSGQQGKPAQP
jgi:penicillin-binding protein 1A